MNRNKDKNSLKSKIIHGIVVSSMSLSLSVSMLSLGTAVYSRHIINEISDKTRISDIESSSLTLNECKSNSIKALDLSIENNNYEKIIDLVKTPKEAIYYLDNYLYDEKMSEVPANNIAYFFYMAKEVLTDGALRGSFKEIYEDIEERGFCSQYALSSAALLSDDGFKTYMLLLKPKFIGAGHEVFIYKTKDAFYGSIGINHSDNIFGEKSLEELVKKITDNYAEYNLEYNTIYNLSDAFPDFIDTSKNTTYYSADLPELNKFDNFILNTTYLPNRNMFILSVCFGFVLLNYSLLFLNRKENENADTGVTYSPSNSTIE